MPQTVRWLIRNYGLGLSLYATFVVAVVIHTYTLSASINNKTAEIRELRREITRQNTVVEKATVVFQNAGAAIVATNVQSSKNYELLRRQLGILQELREAKRAEQP